MTDNFPQLIVFNEKHGDRYFMANSQEEKAIIAAGIIRERFNNGWYFKPDKPAISDDYKNLSEEQLDSLTEELRAIAIKKKASYERAMKLYRLDVEEYANIERIASADSARDAAKITYTNASGRSFHLALQILFDRNVGEYEGYSVEECHNSTYFD